MVLAASMASHMKLSVCVSKSKAFFGKSSIDVVDFGIHCIAPLSMLLRWKAKKKNIVNLVGHVYWDIRPKIKTFYRAIRYPLSTIFGSPIVVTSP